jgi:hypothetical protein
MRRNVLHLTVFMHFRFVWEGAFFEHDKRELIFREKRSTFCFFFLRRVLKTWIKTESFTSLCRLFLFLHQTTYIYLSV